LNHWVGRKCDDLGTGKVDLDALVKHRTLTALSNQLTPERTRQMVQSVYHQMQYSLSYVVG